MATNEQAVRTIPKRTHSYNNVPLNSNNGRRNSNPVTPNDIHVTDTGIVREKQGKVYYNTNPEGVELVTDGNFPLPNTEWDLTGAAEVTALGGRIYSISGGVSSLDQGIGMVVGKNYKITLDVIATNGKKLSNPTGANIYDTSTVGSKVFYITAAYSTLYFKRYSGITDVTIDNVSVKEVVGNTESLYHEVLVTDEFNNLVALVRNSNEGDISTGSYENNQGVKNRPVPRTKTVDGRTSRNIDSNGQPTL